MSRRSFSLLAILALVLFAAYYIFFLKNPSMTDRARVSEREVIVSIPVGATVASLSDTLSAHGLLRSRIAFQLAARALGAAKKLHAGLYRIAPGLSNSEIVRRLTGSEYALILRATFPEGITMYRAASIAHEKLGLDSVIFLRFAFDTGFLHSLGIPRGATSAEGYLFPDTYEFLLSADPRGLITRMVKRWRQMGEDSIYEKMDSSSLSIEQVMTLASIVEAEAKLPQERDTIASIYLNRLKIGMALDADPTVQYGLHLTRPITHSDLEIPNRYNTYRSSGLPPGPICNPGAASIRAVLHPAKSKYLYFVARRDGTGGHYFSRSLAEQERMINLAKANASSEP
ncbi:MAG TPA: endolytic transglycosylase MltG [Candidatus Kapabacteria bacterium]|nr:endolytic transglycosylase MltG [Candidatus Kapabacteria bacterium]